MPKDSYILPDISPRVIAVIGSPADAEQLRCATSALAPAARRELGKLLGLIDGKPNPQRYRKLHEGFYGMDPSWRKTVVASLKQLTAPEREQAAIEYGIRTNGAQ